MKAHCGCTAGDAPVRLRGCSSRRTSSPMRRVSTMRMPRRSVIASMCRPSNSGRARSPSSTGATYSSNSSTSPARRNAPASVAPASTCTSLMSRCGEQRQHRVAGRGARRAPARATCCGLDAARHARVGRMQVERRRIAVAHVAARDRRQARVEHHAQRRHESAASSSQAHGQRADRRPARCRCR